MGFAYGLLMAEEIKTLIPLVIAYVKDQLNTTIPPSVPKIIVEWLECCGLEYALEMTYNATKPYTPAWHEQTLQGMVRTELPLGCPPSFQSPAVPSRRPLAPGSHSRRSRAWR